MRVLSESVRLFGAQFGQVYSYFEPNLVSARIACMHYSTARLFDGLRSLRCFDYLFLLKLSGNINIGAKTMKKDFDFDPLDVTKWICNIHSQASRSFISL
uniref:Uncharacterized protein n=1 Tax=Solanum lycopersicum TaxID=4081 RepID=A0A3Q7F645_SOLLC